MATRTDPSTQSSASGAKPRMGDGHDVPSAHSEVVSRSVSKAARRFGEPMSEAQRHELIAEAAYYLAEARHFEPGHEQEDWVAAEAQLESLSALNS